MLYAQAKREGHLEGAAAPPPPLPPPEAYSPRAVLAVQRVQAIWRGKAASDDLYWDMMGYGFGSDDDEP